MVDARPTPVVAGPALAAFLAARADITPLPARQAGRVAAARLAALLDSALTELTGQDVAHAVVAAGGYGRSEQQRHSDVDVMILIPRGGEEAVRTLYPLWDAGLKVGHSVRTVAQVAEAMQASIETFTALLDARLVTGSTPCTKSSAVSFGRRRSSSEAGHAPRSMSAIARLRRKNRGNCSART